ncbi:hypothetical protein [Pontibacillus yanchengensis]|uniref:Uncharacterized protein n=1 Tax=Pontibacillus yanchengensis Y32 TaxID=1385514 RepID=A0A0A2T8A1_9BACI|nr:hypothetical protein [Pontibacillus yanchengensis]KGP72027.1 hypothetical protein N782_14430 [Pontibacillus yanchengensis Y32]
MLNYINARKQTVTLFSIWLIMGYIGARERVSSAYFTSYLNEEFSSMEPGLGALLGMSPLVITFLNSLIILIVFFCERLQNIRVKNRASKFIYFVMVTGTIFILLYALFIKVFQLNTSLHWNFYLLSVHHILSVLIGIFLVWKEIQIVYKILKNENLLTF